MAQSQLTFTSDIIYNGTNYVVVLTDTSEYEVPPFNRVFIVLNSDGDRDILPITENNSVEYVLDKDRSLRVQLGANYNYDTDTAEFKWIEGVYAVPKLANGLKELRRKVTASKCDKNCSQTPFLEKKLKDVSESNETGYSMTGYDLVGAQENIENALLLLKYKC